jgi:hypothetical protein
MVNNMSLRGPGNKKLNNRDNSVRGELVAFPSASGMRLYGLCFLAKRPGTTIIHVHGSFGNFYANAIIQEMASSYVNAGISFLTFNTTCHDGVAEGERNGLFEYVGGGCTDFGECLADIDGAIQYCKPFSRRIVLQGHSLGCDRVLYHRLKSGQAYDFILLSPCDSYRLQKDWIFPETVEAQVRRLKAEAPRDPYFDWLSSREYGVKGGADWTYCIPITRKSFLSIAEGPPFSLLNVEHPAEYHIDSRVFAYIGGQDKLQVWPPDIMFGHLRQRIKKLHENFIAEGDHMLVGCEEDVISRVIAWARSKVAKLGQKKRR